MKKPLGYYRSPIDRTASYYTYICASQSIRLFTSEIYSLNEPHRDICVFICIQFFFFRFPGQCTVCLLILSNQINNWHLQVKNITKLPVLEIIFLYSQDICPFRSYFWSDILTNWTGQNFLTHKTLKKIAQAVPRPVGCLVIVSVHDVKMTGHFQNLVRQCLIIKCYYQH